MTRRLLAACGLLAALVLAAPVAGAQDGYVGGWTDPAPTRTEDGKPLAYLDADQVLTGQVSHPNGIRTVSAVLVVDPNESPASGCGAEMDPNVVVEQNGTSATFHVTAAFPCNAIYELRATAQANASGGLAPSTPVPYPMPLLVAVAIPPEPVGFVDAEVEVDDEARAVELAWPANAEPDLIGYVITRTSDGDAETLGQVDAGGQLTFVDEDPPSGAVDYEVIAVRNGPDDEIAQVPGEPTAVTVDVPARTSDEPATGDPEDPDDEIDPQLAGDATPGEGGGRPAPGSLSRRSSSAARGRPTPPTTADTGYSETIDYGEVGVAAPEPTADGDDAVVAMFDDTVTGSPWSDKETMTFVAGGLAVLSGAGTILTVTRRAARAAY